MSYGSGKKIVIAKSDKLIDEIECKANVGSNTIGTGGFIEYQSSMANTSLQKIINDIKFEYTVKNLSTSATDYFKWISIFHVLSKLDIYVNNLKIFELPNTSFNIGHRWLKELNNKSETIEEFNTLLYSEIGNAAGYAPGVTPANLFNNCKIFGAGGTQNCSNSLRYILPFFDGVLDTNYIQRIRIEYEIDGLSSGRWNGRAAYLDTNGTPTGISNHFQITNMTLKLNYESNFNPIPPPSSKFTILSKKYYQKEYTIPFSSATSFIVNLERDFPTIPRMKRILFWLYDSAASSTTSAKSYDYVNNNLITSLDFTRNGVVVKRMKTQQQLWRDMNATQRAYYANNLNFLPTDTICPHLYFFDFTMISSQIFTSTKDHMNHFVLAGSSNRDNVFELTLNTSATNAFNLIVIVDTDYVGQIQSDGQTYIIEG